MEDLQDAQQEELRQRLEALLVELRETIESTREGAKPVDLDEPIGRLSRMDAIQQQSMVQANRASAQRRLAQAEGALRRVAEGDYGDCVGCGEPVGYARLTARPEAPFCIACQTQREHLR